GDARVGDAGDDRRARRVVFVAGCRQRGRRGEVLRMAARRTRARARARRVGDSVLWRDGRGELRGTEHPDRGTPGAGGRSRRDTWRVVARATRLARDPVETRVARAGR